MYSTKPEHIKIYIDIFNALSTVQPSEYFCNQNEDDYVDIYFDKPRDIFYQRLLLGYFDIEQPKKHLQSIYPTSTMGSIYPRLERIKSIALHYAISNDVDIYEYITQCSPIFETNYDEELFLIGQTDTEIKKHIVFLQALKSRIIIHIQPDHRSKLQQ